jgi:hypothetical protein
MGFLVYRDGVDADANSVANTIELGVWQFYVHTYSESDGPRIYKGTASLPVAEVSYDSRIVGDNTTGDDSAEDLGIGNDPNNLTSQPFDGIIDEVHIYNRALSATEVKQLYNEGVGDKINTSMVNTGGTLDSGLVGYWTMDGGDVNWGTNTMTDRSGNGNTGTMTNMSTTTSPTDGKIGQAFNFDGVNDIVKVSSNPALEGLSALTISLWMKTPVIGAAVPGRRIVSKSNGATADNYAITYGGSANDENIRFRVTTAGGQQNFDTTTNVVLNKWIHVVGVYNGTDLRVYMDGVLDVTTPVAQTGTITDDDRELSFGDHADDGDVSNRNYEGLLDEVRIYNRALSATEVKQLYNQGR